MDNELQYLTWLAVRSNEIPEKRTIHSSFGFTIQASLYEEWMNQLSEELFPNRKYEFAKILSSSETCPRCNLIPWTLKLPKQVIPDYLPFLMYEQ